MGNGLKNCPFCGGKARRKTAAYNTMGAYRKKVVWGYTVQNAELGSQTENILQERNRTQLGTIE